jgi:hypothetical protein
MQLTVLFFADIILCKRINTWRLFIVVTVQQHNLFALHLQIIKTYYIQQLILRKIIIISKSKATEILSILTSKSSSNNDVIRLLKS